MVPVDDGVSGSLLHSSFLRNWTWINLFSPWGSQKQNLANQQNRAENSLQGTKERQPQLTVIYHMSKLFLRQIKMTKCCWFRNRCTIPNSVIPNGRFSYAAIFLRFEILENWNPLCSENWHATVSRGLSWMKELRGNTSRKGGLPTLPEMEFVNVHFHWGFWAKSREFSDLRFLP